MILHVNTASCHDTSLHTVIVMTLHLKVHAVTRTVLHAYMLQLKVHQIVRSDIQPVHVIVWLEVRSGRHVIHSS